jgi:hypothetical protein
MQNILLLFDSVNLVKVSNIYSTNIVNVLQSSNIYIVVTWFHFQVSSTDKLPNRLCYQCLYRVETFHSFKLSCKESQYTLSNWRFFYGGTCDEVSTYKVFYHNLTDCFCSIYHVPCRTLYTIENF